MNIVVGLGNPGAQYQKTRHNAGFILLEKIAAAKELAWQEKTKWQCQIAENGDQLLVKPAAFMNNSGIAVRRVIDYYGLLPKKLRLIAVKDSDLSQSLIVIHDDIDLPLGKYKISIDSRSAGHRGVESIISHLKTKNFRRIRIGVMGDKPAAMPIKNYVLSRFSDDEMKKINQICSEIIESL